MTATPSGWYPDPGGPPGARLRWWDGNAWTTHVKATVNPTAPQAALDLQAERDDAERARKGLVAGAALYGLQFVLVAIVYHALLHNFFHQISQAQNGTATGATTTISPGYPIASLFLNVISLGLLAVGIIFLIWIHRAATLARRAGLPARHSPAMAVGSFFIPIVNLWFPYQATVDLLPSIDRASFPGAALVAAVVGDAVRRNDHRHRCVVQHRARARARPRGHRGRRERRPGRLSGHHRGRGGPRTAVGGA